jgi:hypothetical protein
MVKALNLILFCGVLLTGCGPARVVRTAAVASYHVATAPVKVARWALKDRSDPASRQTTTDTDVDERGRPVEPSSPQRKQRDVTTTAGGAKSTTVTTSRITPPQAQFPVATAVPGKPGYVYSPYDSSKYVDVTGYTPGSKVKDPYVQKIFIVP